MRLILLLAVMAWSVTVTIDTKYRSVLDLTNGKSATIEESSRFFVEVDKGVFTHTIPSMTSVYYITDTVRTFNLLKNGIVAMPVKSDAGNHYLYVFDFVNGRIMAYPSTGEFILEFDIIDSRLDE